MPMIVCLYESEKYMCKNKAVTSLKALDVHVGRWLFINYMADMGLLKYTHAFCVWIPCRQCSCPKGKNVKKNEVRCKKSVKCVFFAVPNGNSCFLYNIFLRGKFAIPVKKKKWIEINKMRKLVRTMRVF